MIKKLSITNIGPYEQEEIEFQRGKTAIIGENGSGKTTLLKCINMGLWGDSKYILEGNLEDFVRIGKPLGSVKLVFEVKDVEYTIKRTWNISGRNTASLTTPEHNFTGIKNVGEEIEKIFGMPAKNWIDITWARQGEISSLLKGDKEVFDRLLGISDLENAWNRLREVTTMLKNDGQSEERLIIELSKNIGNEKEVKGKIKELTANLDKMNSVLSTLILTNKKTDLTSELLTLKERQAKTELRVANIHEMREDQICPTCEQQVTKEHIAKLKVDNKIKIEELQQIDNEYEELKIRQEEYEQEQRNNRDKEIEKVTIESDIRNTKTLLLEFNNNLKRIKEINTNLNEHKEKLNKLREERALIEKIREGYRTAQPYLRTGRINKLKYGVLTVFEDLFSDRFSYFNIDENYKMTIWDNGATRNINTLSGGESIALAIALRLSIVNGVGGQDMLILDEPTSHLDDSRIEHLIAVLEKITTNDQIFIVTHNNLITSVADNIVTIKRKMESSGIEVE